MTSSRRGGGREGWVPWPRAGCAPSSLTSGPGGEPAQLRHRPLIYWTRDTHIASRGTAPAHPRAFRNIYTRPNLQDRGEGQGVLGATPMPLWLVLWWQRVGTSCAPDPDACVADQQPQSSQLCPQVLALPHETHSPTPEHRAIQLLPTRALPCHPSSDARLASPGQKEGIPAVNPLLTRACPACCPDQSQTPRATRPPGRVLSRLCAPPLLTWPLQVGVPEPLGVSSQWLRLCLSQAPSARPAEDSQQPHCPLGSVCLRAFLDSPSLLLAPGIGGSALPSQAERSEPGLGHGLLLGLPPHTSRGESESPPSGPASGGHSSAGGRAEAGACSGGPWPQGHTGPGVLLAWAPSPPSLLCLSHM